MKIFVQVKLFWNYLSDFLDFCLNERVYHGEDSYRKSYLLPPLLVGAITGIF